MEVVADLPAGAHATEPVQECEAATTTRRWTSRPGAGHDANDPATRTTPPTAQTWNHSIAQQPASTGSRSSWCIASPCGGENGVAGSLFASEPARTAAPTVWSRRTDSRAFSKSIRGAMRSAASARSAGVGWTRSGPAGASVRVPVPHPVWALADLYLGAIRDVQPLGPPGRRFWFSESVSPSLVKMLLLCLLTVLSATKVRAAIAALDCPSAIRVRTSWSRGLSPRSIGSMERWVS